MWNTHPGALLTLKPEFSDHLSDFPFDYGALEDGAHHRRGCERRLSGQLAGGCFSPANTTISASGNVKFTAVIYTQLTSGSQAVHLSAPIFKLARNVAASSFVDQVNILMHHLKTVNFGHDKCKHNIFWKFHLLLLVSKAGKLWFYSSNID